MKSITVLLIIFNMVLNLDLSRLKESINPVYWPLLWDRSKYLVLCGGGGSGKSHFAVQKKLIRIITGIQKKRKYRFYLIRKTKPSLRDSCYQLVKNYIDLWNINEVCEAKDSTMKVIFQGGSSIECQGFDKKEKIKSAEGVNGILWEEVTEVTRDEYEYGDMYCRAWSPNYVQQILCFNPVSAYHWLKEYFFDEKEIKLIQGQKYYHCPEHDITICHTTYKDNRFLSPGGRKKYDSLKDQNENLYRIYSLGLWGILENTIYTEYDIIDEWPDDSYFDEVIYGVDFGFNNPTAIIQVGYKDGQVYEKQLLYRSGLTNQDLKRKMHHIRVNKKGAVYPDSAEPARIKELKDGEHGYKGIYPAIKDVSDGIDYCKTLRPKVYKGSLDLIKEYQSYSYKKDKDGNVIDDPVKFQDHLMDAKRYAEYTHYIRYKRRPVMVTSTQLEKKKKNI